MKGRVRRRGRILGLTAAVTLAGCVSPPAAEPAAEPAPTPSPVGDWHGEIRAGERRVRSAIHIEEAAPGVFFGDIDMPDKGQWDAPLEEVALRDGVLTFALRGGTRRFEGRWDPAAAGWAGQFHNPRGAHPVVYQAGFLGMPVIDGLDGAWEGVVAMQGARRRFLLRITTDAHGTRGLLDLPDRVETDLPVDPLTRQGDAITFAVPALGVRFDGAMDPEATSFTGTLTALGIAAPIAFTRSERGPRRRPQTPAPPFPYEVEEVSYAPAAGVRIHCTLTRPSGAGPRPAALLLSGTGPQDRDEALVGHKPFLVLADHLTRRGLAVLRCDDRGAGRSSGDHPRATLEDFAGDAAAGIDLLRARPDVVAAEIGLIGHSEGGLVAAMVARARPEVAFVVLMAGPGVPIHELLLQQGDALARAEGVPEAVIAERAPLRRAILDAMRGAADPDAARAAVEALLRAEGAPPQVARAQAELEVRPEILRIVGVDPGPILAGVSAPVLAILGSRDVQVPPAENLPALRRALAGHADAAVVELPGLNHLLQTAETGALAEYYDLEETLAPRALETITEWLAARGFGAREAVATGAEGGR